MGGSWLCRKVERIGDLVRPGEHFFFLEERLVAACFQQQSAQILAGDIVHDQVIARTVRKEIRDFWQVGMVETRENSSLAQELFAGFFSYVFREGAVIFDFLQRALTSLETGIVGKVDGTHAALTDPFPDLVAAAQYLPVLEGWEQLFSFWLYGCVALH